MSDLASALRVAGLAVRERGRNVGRDHVNICCVFCGEERFHLGIHRTRGWFLCWVCGAKGRWARLSSVLREQGVYVAWSPEEMPPPARRAAPRRVDLDRVSVPFSRRRHPEYWSYWRGRGLTADDARRCNLRIGIGRLAGRLVLPAPEGYLARAVSTAPDVPRYLSSGADVVLYGPHMLPSMVSYITLVEGPLDALVVPNGVAMLGSRLTTPKLDALAGLSEALNIVSVVFIPDVDQRDAQIRRTCIELRTIFDAVDVVHLDDVVPGVSDPCDAARDGRRQVLNDAVQQRAGVLWEGEVCDAD